MAALFKHIQDLKKHLELGNPLAPNDLIRDAFLVVIETITGLQNTFIGKAIEDRQAAHTETEALAKRVDELEARLRKAKILE